MFVKGYHSDPRFSAGCGQFILTRKHAYWTIDGHASIASSWHDGINLPRQLRQAGFKTDIVDLTQLCHCRMYHNVKQVWNGFVKNAAEGMAGKYAIFVWTTLLGLGQVLPIIWLIAGLITHNRMQAIFAIAALALNYSGRIIIARQFQQPILICLLHPFSMMMMLTIQWYAWLQQRNGKSTVTWKGRTKPNST